MALSFAQDRLQVPRGVVARAVQGTTILLNTETGHYFTLDDIGTHVWSLLSSTSSAQDLYDTLLAEYQVEPERLEEDLETLVGQLRAQGLIEVRRG